jgi:lipopolysaccharide/colanic/teichoic acid biosynthesis glycosyltransferase
MIIFVPRFFTLTGFYRNPDNTGQRRRKLTRDASRVVLQSQLACAGYNGEAAWPSQTPSRAISLAIKRGADIVFSISALLLLLPLLCLVALAIKATSRGPALFCQNRTGLNGKTFRMFKFRSMYGEKCDVTGIRQTMANDPRITPLGRWLRRTSIDELPQLINILRGDMSMIGPRPHAPGMRAAGIDYADLVPYYDARHSMRPGLSGWAQVNRLRGPTDDAGKARARIDHDIVYIQNFSILFDIKILALTLWREFVTGTGI